MSKEDVLGFVKKSLPWIAAAASGNVPALVAMATAEVGKVLGQDIAPTAPALADALSQATPEDILKLKLAEQDFELKMREWGYKEAVELEAMIYADTASARARDVEVTKALGHTNHRANIIAGCALLMVILCLIVVVFTSNMDDYGKATLSLILGRSLGWVEQIFSFEFGTNRASKTKDESIKNLSEK